MTDAPRPGDEVIQSLWIGPDLPTMARMTIASFLDQGHPFHLYTYGKVAGVPDGVRVMSAESILPASSVFQYREHKSYAGFSNHFRYQMLFMNGGWWTDADVICLKPFLFSAPYVFSSERHRGTTYLNATVIKAPAGSPAMGYAAAVCKAKQSADLKWGDTGSKLISDLVDRFDLAGHVEPPETFCPIGYADWRHLLDGGDPADPGADAFGIHLWNEMWQRAGESADARHDPRCLYQRLRRRFGAQ